MKSLQGHSGNNDVFKGQQPQTRGNQSTSTLYIPHIPDDCLDVTYCEHIPNYPEEYITDLLIKVTYLYT